MCSGLVIVSPFILLLTDVLPSFRSSFLISPIIPSNVKPRGRTIMMKGVVISGCPTLINVVGRPMSYVVSVALAMISIEDISGCFCVSLVENQ